MDVLLLVPNIKDKNKMKELEIPVDLGFIATALLRYKFSVEILDTLKENLNQHMLNKKLSIIATILRQILPARDLLVLFAV